MSQDDLFQVQRPEVGRPTDRRVDSEFLAGRPELRGLRPFDPTRDVDLTDEINRVAANLRAEIASKAVSTPAWAISPTTENPRAPEQEELDANEVIHGSRLTPSGAVQPLTWEPHTRMGQWVERGEPTATVADVQATQVVATEAKEVADTAKSVADTAQSAATATAEALKRISVDATLYGVREGAPAQTLIDAFYATPNGGTLVCPNVKLIQTATCSLWLYGRPSCHITIKGNGLRIEADPTMSDNVNNVWPASRHRGGFFLFDITDLDVWDVHYDGRLDARTPLGGDAAGVGGPRSGWQFSNGATRIHFHNCSGNRCMMDGYTTAPAQDNYDMPPEYRTNKLDVALMPTDITLTNCTALHNYRQGISPCGSVRLTIDGGEYAYTGQLGPDKGTSPMAGIDAEAFLPLGWFNDHMVIKGNPQIHHNRGRGLKLDMACRYNVITSGHIYKNSGSGLQIGGYGTVDNAVSGLLIEENCQDRVNGISPSDGFEVEIGGWRNHLRDSTIKCLPGVGSIMADRVGGERKITGNSVVGLSTAADVGAGAVSIAGGGGDTTYDPITGLGLGYNPDNTPRSIRVTEAGDVFSGNTLVNVYNGTVMQGYAAVTFDSEGGTITNNRLATTLPSVSPNKGFDIKAAATKRDNTAVGYQLPGTQVTMAPAPYAPTLRGVDGRGPTNLDYNYQEKTLIRQTAESLLYRVVSYPKWEAAAGDYAALGVTFPPGYRPVVLSVSAQRDNRTTPIPAWLMGSDGVGLRIPDGQAITDGVVTVDIELRPT